MATLTLTIQFSNGRTQQFTETSNWGDFILFGPIDF